MVVSLTIIVKTTLNFLIFQIKNKALFIRRTELYQCVSIRIIRLKLVNWF